MSNTPLVSCIMPTRNRRTFVAQALAYFARQDYPARELVIVDDGDDPVRDLVPDDPRISYTYLAQPIVTGDKRNLACELARGQIIAQWDDDDWYGPRRISHQVAPLLDGDADISGITTRLLDLEQWQGWVCSPALHRQMFVGDVHGGTLVFWRWVWERLAPYPAVALAEDAVFQHNACRRGAVVQKLPNDETFVYIRHGKNSWQFTAGTHRDPAGWQVQSPAELIPAADLAFYAALRPRQRPMPRRHSIIDRPPPARTLSAECPLVTCISVGCTGQSLPLTIACFQQQDYPNRELLIIDDGPADLAALIPADSQVRYIHLAQQLETGRKRNLACELARGTLVAHWDATAWAAPHRLRCQVTTLVAHDAELCGSSSCLAYDPRAERAWSYSYPAQRARFWVAANTLLYHKNAWQRSPFPAIGSGEVDRFLWDSDARKLALAEPLWAIDLCLDGVSRVLPGLAWQPCPLAVFHDQLRSDNAHATFDNLAPLMRSALDAM